MKRKKPDYGLDAPPWFFGAATGGVVLLGLGLWFGARGSSPSGFRHIVWVGAAMLVYAAVHLWGSRFGKRLESRRVLDSIPWRGDEQVLDVGCGHGLMLIEAARRLTTGRATGVDVWSSKDQWDNRPEATLENAKLAGVSDRVDVRDADARELPFPDASFDVVLSSLVVHNIPGRTDRARAVREMIRVLKPGGRLVILDIEGTRNYEAIVRDAGFTDVRREPTRPLFVPGTATVSATKPG